MLTPAHCTRPPSAAHQCAALCLSNIAAFLILFLASPALLHAQFKEPTQEELKMTADPKAPGAAAVYLYYEDISDNSDHFHSLYVRIKVLTERGKELATVNIPYDPSADKVGKIEGRTIHADGSVIRLSDKPSDLVDFKTKNFQQNSAVFTLPGVEVGSILEYRIKFDRDMNWSFLPKWQVQKQYFVHSAHYVFRPGGYFTMLYSSHLGAGSNQIQNKKGAFSLDLVDIPPEPDDDWMPPLNTLTWHVYFFASTEARSGEAFWEKTRWYWSNWIGDFIKPTGPINKAVAEIISPGDTDEQKAVKIYNAVQKLDNTDFSRTKSRAERKKEKLKDIAKAEDVWKQQSGSANDIALLYAAMARSAGLKAWPTYVVNRNQQFFDINYLSDSQFDDDLVMVELGGKKVYLDPGQKMCPFGSLHWKHYLATGFQLADKSVAVVTTPAATFKDAIVQRLADLTIDQDGSVKGAVRFTMTGPTALKWRQMALENDEDEVKKKFIESLREILPEGIEASFDRFTALDDFHANLVASVNVSGSIGSATGKHFFLPGLFFQSRAKHPFIAQDKRTIPIDVHFPEYGHDEVTYHPPAGFNIESMPADVNHTWPEHAQLKIHSSAKNGSVTVYRVFAYNFTLLDPKEYSDLHGFYQKVATADQQQLVLTRAPAAAKGN